MPIFYQKFFIAIFFVLTPILANAQTIATRHFKSINKPIFLSEGFVNFSSAFRNQAASFEREESGSPAVKNRNNAAENLGNDSQIFLKYGVMNADKTKFGAIAKFELNYNSDSRNEVPNLDQAFIFSEGNFGKFEFGNNVAVNQKMKTGAAKIARGAGGINGKYLESINLPTAKNSGDANALGFILLPQSLVGHGGYARSAYLVNGFGSNDSRIFNRSNFRALKDNSFDGIEDATKISYYSPKINDWLFGVSYAPDSDDNGISSVKYYDKKLGAMRDIFSAGLNYGKDFDNFSTEFSMTTEFAKAKNQDRRDLFAYDIGFSAAYFGFTAALSYGSWGKSLQPKSGIYAANSSNSGYGSAGLAYEFGPIAASVTALKSSFQKNKYRAISLGVDYKLAKDLMPYVELTKFSFESHQTSPNSFNDNRGYVALTGILFSF